MVSKVRKPAKTSKIERRNANDQNLIKNFVKEWRIFRGFATQVALAKASGVRAGDINRLESGKISWTHTNLAPLAKALNCHEGDLISRDPLKAKADIFLIFEKMTEKDRKTFVESGWWPFLRERDLD